MTRLLCWLLGCEADLPLEFHVNSLETVDVAWEIEHGHPNRFTCERCKRPIRWKALGGWERVK